MTIVRRVRRLVAGCLALAACADAPTEAPLERGEPRRFWTFGTYPKDRTALVPGPTFRQTGGVVQASHDYGRFFVVINGDSSASGEVYSTADGATYSVLAQGYPTAGTGNKVSLTQLQSFKKRAADASLTLRVTAVKLEGGNYNSDPVSEACAADGAGCLQLQAQVYFEVKAWRDSGQVPTLFYGGSGASLYQFRNLWDFVTLGPPHPSARYLWDPGNFNTSFPIGGKAPGTEATATLARTIAIPIDISQVAIDEEFTVRIVATAETFNLTNRESFSSAYFRDPVQVGGTTVEIAGLEPTGNPREEPPLGEFGIAPVCGAGGSAGAGGTIQFSRAAYRADELPIDAPEQITVTRTGGSSGRVSATLTTADGSATRGADYTAVTGVVAFGDGDATPRTVTVPLVLDTIAEPDKTVNLTLSDPRGCASLGASSAVLTIVDDDRPPPVTAFSVGGTVTGLAGSGLVLRNTVGGEELAVSGGAFTFTRLQSMGLAYDVVVATQPSAPAQVCTVSNGKGTMPRAAVTSIAVTCTTPTAVAGLDPAFGTGGRVATPLTSGEGEAVVVQPDGRVVVAGKSAVASAPGGTASADFTVLRYQPDGSPDASFGAGGQATAGFAAGRTDEAFDAAVQADGRVVVVGRTQTPSGDFDFGLARFTPDGRLDPGFGTGGTVVTDFGAGSAYAQAVVVQPDGRIVVAGHSTVGTGNDFAVARYNADGTPDASFGTGGRVTTNVVGRTDLAFAVALEPGGRIVVAGRAEQSGSRGDDFALVRYNANGALDTGFGAGGIVTTDFAGSGSQQANDVAVLPDGRIVAAGYSGAGTGTFDFALARYTSDGRLDAGFGTGGTVVTDLSAQDDFGEGLAVQADGRLVVIGRRTSATVFDLALTRYLATGALDAGFGTAGALTVDFFGAADEGQGVAIQPDGRIVGVGHARNGTAPNVVLVRVVP